MKQMKKVLIMLMAIAMLSVTGCSDKNDKEETSSKSEVSDSAEDDEDDKDDEKSDEEDAESQKEEENKKEEEEENKREDEQSKKEEEVEDSKPEESDSESADESEEEDSTAQGSGEAGDLSGFWKYEDDFEVGYLEFTENEMIIYFDMSSEMHFEDGEFCIDGVEEEEGVAEVIEEVDGNELTIIAKNYATDEEIVFLVLEACGGQDADAFDGRYLLVDSEDASIASYIGEGDTYFYLKDDLMLIGMAAECVYNDDQTLTMTFDGETEEMTYEFDGETLILTDSIGDSIEVVGED